MSSQKIVPCRECGGALQRVPSMPGHLVCGSGHVFLESDAIATSGGPSSGASSGSDRLRRVGEGSADEGEGA